MKQVIFTIALLALVSCKDGKTNANNTPTSVNETPVEETHKVHKVLDTSVFANNWTNDILLNEGAKWLANVETNVGVKQMQKTLETVETTTLEDYHQLAAKLSESKNFVIKNCTMKGASHDNLHVWLLPLASKIEMLSKVESIEEAQKIKQSINENVNAYNNFFE